MARTKRSQRSYAAGEWGRNRVRVFPDPKTGLFQIEWRENGRRLSRSLKHREWARAKKPADEFAAGFAGPEMHGKAEVEPEPLTLETLFDIYGEEVTPTKRGQSRLHDRAATRMFLGCFGRNRDPATLSKRDWDRFIRARRAGRVGASGSPVSDRTIEYDLKFLIAVFNWAAKSRDEHGRLLLDSNPLKGLKTPKEKNPVRVVLAEEEYQVLLKVSCQIDWRFHVYAHPPRWRGSSPTRRVQRPRYAVAVGGVRGGTAPRQPLPGTREAWPQRVGWLPSAKHTRRATLGTLGRESLHTRTFRSPLHAVSTTGNESMSQELQLRARGGLGAAVRRLIP